MPLIKPIRAIQLNKSHPLARGLVGCWLFNEGGGNKVFDLSGNGNTGTLNGDTHFVPGKFGSALDFDGTGDYVNMSSISLYSAGNSVTLLVWFQPTVDSTQNIILDASATELEHFRMEISPNNRLRAHFGNGTSWGNTTQETNTLLVSGQWYQCVSVLDNANNIAYMYVNGVLDKNWSETIDTGTPPNMRIGDYIGGGYGFPGQIDNVMIFNRALSAAEVQQLYREPFCMFEGIIRPASFAPVGGTTHLGAATLSGVGSLATIGERVTAGTATLAGIGTLASIGRGIFTGAATLTGAGTLVTAGVSTLIGKAILAGAGTLSGIGQGIVIGATTLAGVGTLATNGIGVFVGAATLAGVGTLSTLGGLLHTALGTLSGIGTLVTAAVSILIGKTTVSGIGTLVTVAVGVLTGKVTTSGTGSLSAIGEIIAGPGIPAALRDVRLDFHIRQALDRGQH